MKKLFLATAAMLIAGPALAADLPRGVEPAAPAYIAPTAFNWTGFYAGLHAGYGFSGRFGSRNNGDSISGAKGFVGGAQVGFNYQIDPLVVGLEGEISYADVKKTRSYYGANGVFLGTNRGELSWKGSLTPRVGVAIDRVLPYVKGGLAFGNVELKDIGTNYERSQSKTLWGWTLGVGVEYAITNNVTAKVEYDYTDLQRKNFIFDNGLVAKAGYRGSEVKGGVNYKF